MIRFAVSVPACRAVSELAVPALANPISCSSRLQLSLFFVLVLSVLILMPLFPVTPKCCQPSSLHPFRFQQRNHSSVARNTMSPNNRSTTPVPSTKQA